MSLQKVNAVTDNDGHWYIIPNDLVEDFWNGVDSCEDDDDYESFEDKFGKYQTGGDLNLVQLWAEI